MAGFRMEKATPTEGLMANPSPLTKGLQCILNPDSRNRSWERVPPGGLSLMITHRGSIQRGQGSSTLEGSVTLWEDELLILDTVAFREPSYRKLYFTASVSTVNRRPDNGGLLASEG